MTEITIFHYHLMPGGITSVIETSVKALLKYNGEDFSFRIICGRKENTEKILDSINREFSSPQRVSIEVYPLLDYALGKDLGNKDIPLISDLLTSLSKKQSIWWIHNHHLGKNPYFTEALLNFIENNPQQKILLHIHDFPECGRYDNLKELKKVLTHSFYPVCKQVAYVTINSRDRKFLVQAGIPSKKVFLLLNPLKTFSRLKNGTEKKDLSKLIPNLNPNKKTLLYPVRNIRRKNSLEAVMIALLSNNNLIISLPGISKQEEAYSKAVETCFDTGLIQGSFGIGTKKGIELLDLVDFSDMILSSSVQEGFGYLFLDSQKWEKPLIARKLDILDGIIDVFSKKNIQFYDSILVPIEEKTSLKLLETYYSKIDQSPVSIPLEHLKLIKKTFQQMLSRPAVDFSYLPVSMQLDCIKKYHNIPEYQKEVKTLNSNLIMQIDALPPKGLHSQTKNLERLFGHYHYSSTFSEITKSAFNKVDLSRIGDIDKNMVKVFYSPGYLRLIYNF